jgi:pyruvate-formate lyase-activating enzyme
LPYHRIAHGKYEKLQIENKMKEIREPEKKEIESVKLFFEQFGFNAIIGG